MVADAVDGWFNPELAQAYLAKAKEETGKFVVAGNTSRIAAAAEAFEALYGIETESNTMKDQ